MKPTAQMGQYEIYEKLGQGGVATIFLARNREKGPQSPLVALKCLNPKAAQERLNKGGFFNEISILARTSHPNLLEGRESGELRGVHYVVTDFVDGQDLRAIYRRIAKGASILNLLPFLICEILSGVAFLHNMKDDRGKNAGITHNDLTPGNILVGYNGEVKIVDFGAATLNRHKKADSGQGLLGTLSYLPPEKLLGNRSDHRADLYAVGVLLYELAVGAPPFVHKNGETDSDVLLRITEGQYQSIESHGKKLPKELRATIERAMAIKPRKRFKDAQEMALALGFEFESENAKASRERRQFLLGAAIKNLFPKEFQATAHRRSAT